MGSSLYYFLFYFGLSLVLVFDCNELGYLVLHTFAPLLTVSEKLLRFFNLNVLFLPELEAHVSLPQKLL